MENEGGIAQKGNGFSERGSEMDFVHPQYHKKDATFPSGRRFFCFCLFLVAQWHPFVPVVARARVFL